MSNEIPRMIAEPEYKTSDTNGCIGLIVVAIGGVALLGIVGSLLAVWLGAASGAICFCVLLGVFVLVVISQQLAELIAVTKQRPHAGQLPNPLPVVAQRGEPKQAVTPTAPPIKVRE